MKYNSTETALFCLRISIFVLMIVWALLKVMNPASYGGGGDNPGIFENFYGFSTGPSLVLILGILQIILLLAFVAGAFKTVTYGFVLLMNLTSFIVSLPRIIAPYSEYPNVLFVASVPVLGASIALFLMRNQDRFLSIKR